MINDGTRYEIRRCVGKSGRPHYQIFDKAVMGNLGYRRFHWQARLFMRRYLRNKARMGVVKTYASR